MMDRPDPAELAEAVRGFLEAEVVPAAQDPRLRFRALVAANALGILARDLAEGEKLSAEEARLLARLLDLELPAGTAREQALALNLDLARRIRGGAPPSGTLQALQRIAAWKLQIASPRRAR